MKRVYRNTNGVRFVIVMFCKITDLAGRVTGRVGDVYRNTFRPWGGKGCVYNKKY